MKYLSVFLLFSFLGFQFPTTSPVTENEFEGIIYYDVKVEVDGDFFDKKAVEQFLGKKKKYYFKAGQYKWETQKGTIEYEIYNPSIDPRYTFTKTRLSDTLIVKDFSISSDSIVHIDTIGIETICGIDCQGFEFLIETDSEIKITRKLYFPINTLKIAKNQFEFQKAMCNGFIYDFGGSLPLKLELSNDYSPIRFSYTATNIKRQPLENSVFEIDTSLPKKYQP